MHVIEATNVRDALMQATEYVLQGFQEDSRLGKVMVAKSPVTIRYSYPKQHVLLNAVRNANPFFHLMEAMWMLAGRNDTQFLDHYIKDFGKMFGLDGVMWDSYGYRWKQGLAYNQLEEIVNQFKNDPTTRQAVLQMWGAGRDDLRARFGKPCNLVATFRLQAGRLHMIVFNRSNDLIWGCCGANAVHFPIMQEYIAGKIGVEMGEYWQVTSNLHMYVEQFVLMWNRFNKTGRDGVLEFRPVEAYGETFPLMEHPDTFDAELSEVIDFIDHIHDDNYITMGNMKNRFLSQVVARMAMAHHLYKNKKMDDALDIVDTVVAADWRQAGREWLERHNERSTGTS